MHHHVLWVGLLMLEDMFVGYSMYSDLKGIDTFEDITVSDDFTLSTYCERTITP